MPMDPTYPKDRMKYIMEDAGMRVLIVAGDCHMWVAMGQVISVSL